MHPILKNSLLALLLLNISYGSFANQPDYNFPPFAFEPTSINPAPHIKQECKHLTIDSNNTKETKATLPAEAFKKREVGYAVYDFQIDQQGNIINIELASPDSKKYFIRNSMKALNNLKFTVNDEWINSCSGQKYRIGYAFRIMTECTYKEFPAPIINMCSEGIVVKLN